MVTNLPREDPHLHRRSITLIQDPLPNRRLTSPRAFLAAVGLILGARGVWKPITDKVAIPQKTLRYTPDDTRKAVFLAILAGTRGLVEVGKRLRPDQALHDAFGPAVAADQSVLQDTLDACTPENILEMKEAVTDLYRQPRLGDPHNFTTPFQ